MLTRRDLIELDELLGQEKVLSVFLDGSECDPAERTSWRRSLEARIAELREQLQGSSHTEREEFDACVRLLTERLEGVTGFLPSRGWVAFVTSRAVRYTEALPVRTPMLVAWDDGIRLAPYIHALDAHRPAIVAILDARMARVYRYSLGSIELLESHHAHAHAEPVLHMGRPSDSGFHSGTRGTTGTDEAERDRRAGRERMMRDLSKRLAALSEPDAWVLFGGVPQAMSEAISFLPEATRARADRILHLDVHASDSKIAARVASKVTELRTQHASDVVDQIIAQSANATKGVTGEAPTREAIDTGAVDLLCLTERFAREHVHGAEVAIRVALDRHADVEVVDGTPAERFDGVAGGIGARLRYMPWRDTSAGRAT